MIELLYVTYCLRKEEPVPQQIPLAVPDQHFWYCSIYEKLLIQEARNRLIPFMYFCFFVPTVWYIGTLVKEHTSAFWYCPPKSYHRGLLGVLYSLKGLTCMFAAIDSTLDGFMVAGEAETRWGMRWAAKATRPGIRHHSLWVSQWDKSSLMLRMTESDDNNKFWSISHVEEHGPKWRNCLIDSLARKPLDQSDSSVMQASISKAKP